MEYNIKADLEKAAKHAENARSLVNLAKSEKRELSDDENVQFDAEMADHQRAENAANQKRKLNSISSDSLRDIEKKADEAGKSVDEVADNKRMSEQVLKSYLMRGLGGLNQKEAEFYQRAQSTTTNSEGGYTVDETMGNKIIETMKNFGGMRSVCDIQTTSKGEQINWPTNNDTAAAGAWLAENSAAAQEDLTFGTTAINAWTLSSKYIPVSSQLLQDSSFNIEQFIVNALSRRLGRGSNLAYTTGDGSSKPTGIVETSLIGKAAAGVAAVTFSEILDLKHAVDRDYRVNGKFMFNDNTLVALKKIAITSANQSLWQPGIVGGAPSTIDGDEYVVNNDMPDMAAGAHALLYGDFKHYLIRDAQGINIRRSEHVNFLKNQITFLGELRTDGKLLDVNAVKHMRMANT